MTDAPSTFTHVTAEKLGNILAPLALELFVDDSRVAGNEFEEMLDTLVL